MEKYIRVSDAVQTVMEKPDMTPDEKAGIIRRLKAAPAADVVEVRHGRWIYEPGHIPHCSECGRYSDDADTGEAICCPFCGAKMDGGREE